MFFGAADGRLVRKPSQVLTVQEIDELRAFLPGPTHLGFGAGRHEPLAVVNKSTRSRDDSRTNARVCWVRRGLNDANETLWGGFVIEGSSARVYHSGDTAYFEGFTEIKKRVGPIDAALLPIGAYDPAWFMSKQHINPEEAVRAFGDLGAREFIAMHWGTFQLTDEPLDEPPARLSAEWQR